MKRQASSPDLQRKTMLVSKYGSREDVLKRYNPDYQREICGNADACFFGDYPTMAELRLAYGKNAPVMWMIPQLYNLSEYCGCREKLQGKPLEECAYIISNEFYYLKVSELMLFMYRFKAGRYGRFYGSVDPLIITESLRKFCEERWYAYEQREKEEREKREREEAKNAITYEEHLRRKKEREYEGEVQGG